MKKVDTTECQLVLAAHYAQSNIDTQTEDWVLKRKYKNFHGFTCRDFYNEKENKEAIVIVEVHNDEFFLTVIEDSSYKMFLKEMAEHPLFYYIPVISNDGLVFYFEKTMKFDATGKLDPDGYKQKPYLIQKLKQIFKPNEIFTLGVEMLVAFPKHKTEKVIKLLEKNNLSFNPRLFDLINQNLYQPFKPNISFSIYDFPEDKKLTEEESISLIFEITSQTEPLTEEQYARIKKLLQKVKDEEEMQTVENLILGLKGDDEKLKSLIEMEKNRKKSKILWSKLSKISTDIVDKKE